MSQTLTIELSDELYQVLKEIAQGLGKTPEEKGLEWITATIERIRNDPLEKFVGAIQSDVPDWTDRHDYYIGQALMEEMRGGERRED